MKPKISSYARLEQDALGPVLVGKDYLFGAFTVRASKLFNLSGQKTPSIFIKALGLVKIACCKANAELGMLNKKLAVHIEKAALEFANGDFIEQSQLDPFQAGAGTPLNMNANEIIANRANQLLGKPLGSYKPVHPNDHVNMGQSTNDVIPTAVRIAVLFKLKPLLNSLNNIIKSFHHHSQKYHDVLKVGRTHLQDAVPISVSQELNAWSDMLKKDYDNLLDLQKHLLEVGIGGNAIGSGINTHPQFKETVVQHLRKLTTLCLKSTKNTFETTQSMTPLLNFSSGLRTLATDVIKIANDLKLLNMGPKAGISEYILPEVEPGSSIMPGKVNPSICEALEMACFQVLGNDMVVALASQHGQLQLNIFAPLIMFNLLWSVELLANSLIMFNKQCVQGLKINKNRCKELLQISHALATAISSVLGYHQTALVVNEALKKGKTLKEIILSKKLMDENDFDKLSIV